MTTMSDARWRDLDRRFLHEEEARLRARTRRNLLLAAWACERMRLTGEVAGRFVEAFTDLGVFAGDEPLLASLQGDLAAARAEETLPALRRELGRCAALARAEQRVGLALAQGSSV